VSVQVELSSHLPPTGALGDAIDVFVGDVTAAGLRVQWVHRRGVEVGGEFYCLWRRKAFRAAVRGGQAVLVMKGPHACPRPETVEGRHADVGSSV
jgi:hypothetical protein